MLKCFEEMNAAWFRRAFVYTGSVTDRTADLDFRYRYEQVKRVGEDGKEVVDLKAQTYSTLCYELAQDVEERTFLWTEEGVEELKDWYQSQYEKFLAAHKKGE